ncbi:hypothetical protein M0R45_014273 [Rubus argutus]|uniref:non-specific serine/threonine protein kinase n=1 Tax=Rubus argutus TaxID=59490 RepID=A0AAW1XPH0_RUBAR
MHCSAFRVECLQRDFPCNRGPGLYNNFGIKCGGPQITSSNGIVYEKENETLGPATYFVNDESRWGVSNVGLGRRVFNIYIQGNLVEKDFDIKKEAGAYFLALQRNYTAQKKKPNNDYDEELLGIDIGPLTFSFSELKTATNDFSPNNKLGEGGFGPVFKGTLNDGRVIAVKQLSAASHQGKNQFVTEIATISAVQHHNLVTLYGFCIEGVKRLLVYEYLENKSLDQALFGKRNLNLDWSTHFGLAKLFDDQKTHISTRVAGTIGYLAPEYAMRGHLTEKADVFAFGVVALEIVSGRPNSDLSLEEDKMYLLEWAWHLHENKCELELVDPRLSEFNEEEVKQ